MTHDTPMFTGVLPGARRWHDDIVQALRRLHANGERVQEHAASSHSIPA